MIQLSEDNKEGVINTVWILKLSRDTRKKRVKSGEEKTYLSYFTSFPQELYDFFDIKNNTIYLIKENQFSKYVILTDTKPSLPVNYISIKLITRRKQNTRENRTPTTSFTISKKMFNNLDTGREVIIRLHPKSIDRYRNKLGLITLKII